MGFLREFQEPDAKGFFLATIHRNVFRGGLVFKAHRLFLSLNSRLESNKEEEEGWHPAACLPDRSRERGGGLNQHALTERIFIELMTSDRKLKASREGSK